jgi:ABC-2 type transport system permease protein
MSNVANIVNVARREFLARIRTRSFVLGTALLMIGVIGVALVPILVQYLEGDSSQEVAVYVGTDDLATDVAPTLDALLNAPTGTPGEEAGAGGGGFTVTDVGDLATARQAVADGEYVAVLAVERAANGELEFTIYTNEPATGRTAQLVRQASNAVAIADRLERAGVDPTKQAALFAPASYTVSWPDPDRSEPLRGSAEAGSQYLLGIGMTVLIFMMIVLYGNWIAMSVVEEKSSRVMEVILNAATPYQLMAGKIVGVGSVALVQFGAILLSGIAALLLQGRVAEAVLGGQATSITLPEGLTFGVLVAFTVYGVLGFLLYATLYAAAGSLVSRQEDVSQVVMPMALVSTAGYLIAIYTVIGFIDIRSGWMLLLSQVPFVSPFIMLSRIIAGEAAAWEIALSIVILVVSIGIAMWVASRVYSAGVLMYGQRPSVRSIWRLARVGM